MRNPAEVRRHRFCKQVRERAAVRRVFEIEVRRSIPINFIVLIAANRLSMRSVRA